MSDFRDPKRWNSVQVPAAVAQRAVTNVDEREDGCWISRYSVASHGYSQIGWQAAERPNRKVQMVLAHRAAWVHAHGQVPLGMTIDHICKERRCVNPDHLRLLPNYENARRNNGRDWPMGVCANGHSNELIVGSWARNKRGKKRKGSICSICRRLYQARYEFKVEHPGRQLPDDLLLASERAA